MRRLPAIFLFAATCALFVSAQSVSAATPEATYQKICQGYTGNPTATQLFDTSTNSDTMRAYLQRKVICPSACYDVKIALARSGFKLKMTTTATNTCVNPQPQGSLIKNVYSQLAEPNNRRNCSSTGQGAPSVTLQSDQILGYISEPISVRPKSRCDPKILAAISAFANGNLQGGFSTAARLNNPSIVEDLSAKNTDRGITVPQDVAQYGTLLKSFDPTLTDTQIEDAIKNNPDDVKMLAECRANSDVCTPDKLSTAANNIGINLNPDVTGQIERMKADWEEKQAAESKADPYEPSNPDTFDRTERPSIADKVGQFCDQIAGGCGNACVNQPQRLVCRTNNPGAIVDSAVTRKYGCMACGASNNTACCPSMDAGVAAMSELITGPGYFGGRNNTLMSAICKYAPEAGGNDCRTYALTLARQIGVSPMQTLDPQNSSQMAQVMMAISKYEHGGGVAFSLTQLQSGLDARYGIGNLPDGDPDFASRFVPGGAPNSGYYSPFAVGPGDVYYTPVPVGYATGGVSQPVQSVSQVPTTQTTQTPVSQLIGQTGTGQTTVTAAVQPVASLLSQPQTVKKGGSVTVSWSSVGMNTSQPCQLFAGTSFMAQGNEGSRVFDTKSVAASTTVTFTLQCFSLTDIKVQKTSTVTVQ